MSLRVSVALCTHNGEAYLREQLTSILNQSVAVHEIVLSDDASSDDTVALARSVVTRFEQESKRTVSLTVLQNETALGVTKNFEQAVRACAGDLISLCDQDDVWRSDRLELIVGEFERRPELTLLNSDARLVDGEGHPLGVSLMQALGVSAADERDIHGGAAFGVFLRRNLVTGATVVFRRQLLEHALPFFTPWVHDEWLAMFASIVGSVDFLPQPLIDYRQHGNNQIGAMKLTLRGKLQKLREPRNERNERLVQRGDAMLRRLEELAEVVPSAVLEQVRAKVAHDRWRHALPRGRVRRIVPVLQAAAAGRYRRFSNGMADVLRDIVQPA